MTTDRSPEESPLAPAAEDASAPSEAAPAPADTKDDVERRHGRLEARLAQAEAQIYTLQERMMEINAAQGSAKQRALWSRVFLLLALLGAFFIMQYLKGKG